MSSSFAPFCALLQTALRSFALSCACFCERTHLERRVWELQSCVEKQGESNHALGILENMDSFGTGWMGSAEEGLKLKVYLNRANSDKNRLNLADPICVRPHIAGAEIREFLSGLGDKTLLIMTPPRSSENACKTILYVSSVFPQE